MHCELDVLLMSIINLCNHFSPDNSIIEPTNTVVNEFSNLSLSCEPYLVLFWIAKVSSLNFHSYGNRLLVDGVYKAQEGYFECFGHLNKTWSWSVESFDSDQNKLTYDKVPFRSRIFIKVRGISLL